MKSLSPNSTSDHQKAVFGVKVKEMEERGSWIYDLRLQNILIADQKVDDLLKNLPAGLPADRDGRQVS